MRRAYVDVSHFRSPYDSPTLSLSGLGRASLPTNWPRGRSYVNVAHFRAPYDQGYFQDNQLFGLGAGQEVIESDASLLRKADLLKVGVASGAAGMLLMWLVMRNRGTSPA